MTVRKRKKSTKYRGSKTHGCGSMKKRRGAGNRGGRGAAGSGKRGDCKKPTIWANKKYFGKHGFKKGKRRNILSTVNIDFLEKNKEKLIKKAVIKQESGSLKIDIKDLKCDKLLGKGKIKSKFLITARFASEKAVKKIEAAGGKVTLEKQEKKPESKKAEKPGEN